MQIGELRRRCHLLNGQPNVVDQQYRDAEALSNLFEG
jgi:hypothetical protein